MFTLTKQERQALLFLLTIALIGIAINFLSKTNSRIKQVISFDENLIKINLNTADETALISVEGIGKKTAERILTYRKENSGFKNIAELQGIKGINSAKYEKIKDWFYIK